jgi:hypothetical protein
MMHSLSDQNLDRECVTGYTSITAFNPRFSGFYGNVANHAVGIARQFSTGTRSTRSTAVASVCGRTPLGAAIAITG